VGVVFHVLDAGSSDFVAFAEGSENLVGQSTEETVACKHRDISITIKETRVVNIKRLVVDLPSGLVCMILRPQGSSKGKSIL
jgi:hypothetical protein